MLQIEGTRDAQVEIIDTHERMERAEAAEHRERNRRIAAEETAAELAELVAREIDARRHAEDLAGELAVMLARAQKSARVA